MVDKENEGEDEAGGIITGIKGQWSVGELEEQRESLFISDDSPKAAGKGRAECVATPESCESMTRI